MKLYTTTGTHRRTCRKYYKKNFKKISKQQSERYHTVKKTPEFQEARRAYNKERKAIARAWLKDYKAKLTCSKCPESHPACLDFHHRDPTTKKYGIADMISSGGSSIKAIHAEIDKCDVLCKNCHAKHHYTNES